MRGAPLATSRLNERHRQRSDHYDQRAEHQHGNRHFPAQPHAQGAHHFGIARSASADHPQDEQRPEPQRKCRGDIQQRTDDCRIPIRMKHQLKQNPEQKRRDGEFVGNLASPQIGHCGNGSEYR